MLELLYTSTKTVPLGSGIPKAVYIASWDAVLFHRLVYPSHFAKLFRDGTAFEMGQVSSFSGEFLSAEGGRGAASLLENGAVNLALLDELSGLPVLGNNLNGVDFTGKVNAGSFVDHSHGLVYTPAAGNQIIVYALATGAIVRTLAITGLAVSQNYTKIHYAGSASLFLTNYNTISPDGSVAIADRVTGAMSFQGKVNAGNQAVVYDTTHNVAVAILNSGQVAVYALNNVGSSLSAPSFSPSPALYSLSKVTTRLTDIDGQGVAGKAVLWWLTGDKGTLEHPYTLTDADGYAMNWYYGPAGDFGLGSETVNIEVTQ